MILNTLLNPPNMMIAKNEKTNKYNKHIVAAIGTANISIKNILNIFANTTRMRDVGNPAISVTMLNAVDINCTSKNDSTYNNNEVAYKKTNT